MGALMMAHGKHYSAHQKGIIKRYYENKDHIMNQKLGEIVSELYLCTDEKKKARLWKSAHNALVQAGAHKKQAELIVEARDVESLARLVGELF
jgi:hypothetical protein